MEIKNCYTGNGTVKVGISVKPYKCYDEYCNLQIVLVNLDDGKPFVSATHDLWKWCNTPKKVDCPIDCGYLDTHNIPELPKIMEENGLGVFTGRVEIGQHGIEYPLYRFNFDKLHELCPTELAEYFKKNNINDIKDLSVKVMDFDEKTKPFIEKEEIIESVNKLYEGLNTVSTIEDLKTYFDKHNITNYYIYVTDCCFQSGYDNINAFARDCESLLSVEQIYIGDYGCLEEVKINFDEGRANSIYDITFCILYDGDLYADDITLYELKDYDFIPFTKDDIERD